MFVSIDISATVGSSMVMVIGERRYWFPIICMASYMTQLPFTQPWPANEGERIPRRPLPDFAESGTLSAGLKRDGIVKTALEDSNEYGPHSMILLLMVVASITGGILLAFRYI